MIQRDFLGVGQTLRASVDEWLRRNSAAATWLAVETREAARRLESVFSWTEVFAVEAASEALAPSIRSIDPVLRRDALRTALEALDDFDRDEFFPSIVAGDPIAWESALDALDSLFSELAWAGFNAADVLLHGRDVLPFDGRRQWEVLGGIESHLRASISAMLPKPVPAPKRLILAAIGDLPGNLTRWIHEHDDVDVVALIAAEESDAAMFNDLGAVLPARWAGARLPIDFVSMKVAASPSSQAAAALDSVEGAEPNAAVVALDDELTPFLEAEGIRRGLLRPAGPRRFRSSPPFRLLAVVADYLELDGFLAFSALVRHPDFEKALDSNSSVRTAEAIVALDELAAWRMPDRVKRFWNAGWSESDQRLERAVDALVRSVDGLLGAYFGEQRSFAEWSDPILSFLERVYGIEQESPFLSGLRQALKQVSENESAGRLPAIEAWQAIRRWTERFGDEKIERDDDQGMLQRWDWPDVVWSDAETVTLVGFNEGRLPTSHRGGFFLPNELRERLCDAAGDGRRIADNEVRYAVDAYRLSACMAGRTKFRLIAGRVGANGEPLLPSRFWFAVTPEEIAERIARFYDPPTPSTRTKPAARPATESLGLSLPPRPFENLPPVKSLRVTAFRDFIACPYRFYLRHILGLKTPDVPSDELTGAQFGTLAHHVLERLVGIHETAPERIFERLSGILDEQAQTAFGDEPTPAVRIQIEQLRARLKKFTEKHAKDLAGGWRIDSVETSIEESAGMLDVDGEPFRITGRIDRIDVSDRTGAWRLLDYKTGDSADSPDKTHRKHGEWVDLQLPLYWHLTERVRGEGGHVGYILLGKDPSKIGMSLATWNREDAEVAVERAKDIIRRIRRGEFWPPTSPAPDYFLEFAGLCRDGMRQ